MQADHPITWVICFHMQQYAEKYLKAFLIFHGREHPRTHNIPALVHLCAQTDASFHQLKEWDTREVSEHSIKLRIRERVLREAVPL